MTKDLGKIEGPLLIFGGPYSNLHAVRALKKVAESRGLLPHQIICTGDIVGYCAYPDEVIQETKEWGIHCIAGNVEFNLRDEADDCGCNFEEGSRCDVLSQQWYPFARENVSASSMKYLHALPTFITFKYEGRKHFVVHGSFDNTSEFIFKSTPWEMKKKVFDSTGADVIIAGHSGLPFVDTSMNKTWLNAGVIGMPANDGTPETWFALVDQEDITFHRLSYDHLSAHRAMIEKSLPGPYARTLLDGLWDNCEILPKVEAGQQGVRIVF